MMMMGRGQKNDRGLRPPSVYDFTPEENGSGRGLVTFHGGGCSDSNVYHELL